MTTARMMSFSGKGEQPDRKTFHQTPNGFFDGTAFQDEPKLYQHSSMSLENKDRQQQQ